MRQRGYKVPVVVVKTPEKQVVNESNVFEDDKEY